MKRFVLHGRIIDDQVQPYVEDIVSLLLAKDAEVYVTSLYHTLNPIFQSRFALPIVQEPIPPGMYDIFLSVGGDGTFLETLTYVGALEIPIVGINTGRLGFLASISKEGLKEAVNLILNGEYLIDRRAMVSLKSSVPLFDGKCFALNEFAILRKETSSMIVIKAYIDGAYLNSYWADGLMVATPTGSTGYSLSCGGPIILPETNNFIVTPVSPHNLNIRPLIVPDRCELSFEIESRSAQILISLDSRSVSIDSDVKLKISKAQFYAHILRLKGISFIETLRNKLSWGLDKRN